MDDANGLPPQRLIDFAIRLPAYAGVVAARARAEENGVVVDTNVDRVVDSSAVSLSSDPVLSQFFDVEVIE